MFVKVKPCGLHLKIFLFDSAVAPQKEYFQRKPWQTALNSVSLDEHSFSFLFFGFSSVEKNNYRRERSNEIFIFEYRLFLNPIRFLFLADFHSDEKLWNNTCRFVRYVDNTKRKTKQSKALKTRYNTTTYIYITFVSVIRLSIHGQYLLRTCTIPSPQN